MRSPDRTATGTAAVAVAALVAGVSLLAIPAVALAASPSPTADALGDPRSSGQGPGLVGDPLTAILVVAAIALVTLAATLLYVRATGGPGRSRA